MEQKTSHMERNQYNKSNNMCVVFFLLNEQVDTNLCEFTKVDLEGNKYLI
jgi:hypothetical protein